MASLQQFSVKSGPTHPGGEAQPGYLTVTSTTFNSTGMAAIAAGVAGFENTAENLGWLPYDRMIQVPTRISGADTPFGTYVWQRDKILYQNPAAGNAWQVKHTCVNQRNHWDFGIKTGLTPVQSGGKAYVCGLYPGATAGSTGWVLLDVRAGTWESAEVALSARFNNCTYAVAVGGTLIACTEGKVYQFRPGARTLTAQAVVGLADSRNKVFSLGGRVFMAAVSGGTLSIHELFGGVVKKLLDVVSGVSTGSDSEFGVLTVKDSAFVYFFDTARKKHVWQVQSSGAEFSALTLTDRTFAQFGDPAFQVATARTSPRIMSRNVTEEDPSGDTGGAIVIQGQTNSGSTSVYGDSWGTNRHTGPSSAPTPLVPVAPGNHTYCSAPNGGGHSVFKGTSAVHHVACEIISTQELGDGTGSLEVRFALFKDSVGPATQSVRLWYGEPGNSKSFQTSQGGTISSASNGTLDGFGRLHSVSTHLLGAPTDSYHTLVWDRDTDGVDLSKKHTITLEALNSF